MNVLAGFKLIAFERNPGEQLATREHMGIIIAHRRNNIVDDVLRDIHRFC